MARSSAALLPVIFAAAALAALVFDVGFGAFVPSPCAASVEAPAARFLASAAPAAIKHLRTSGQQRPSILDPGTMARSSAALLPVVLAAAAFAALVFNVGFGAFVPSPSAASVEAPAARLLASVAPAAMSMASALPAFAEEIDSAEAYNRKVMTGVSVCLSLALVLMGIIIFYTRRVVENKWLN
eukprot:CAMPEP_0177327552 /NCGR_PEP_ID=MMETSP0368-20130122/18955_1 /TAXON_ID=447022 ORGANISM="Scrippsiella hangoei-like, Strain SHHI-4" /NCGR_SAMPLE_ID=MMETSP0368 /ASSEMBLY_ACC=CAM_ASM_000363 /LENGTH=183 /DNA_ID=CAMNT_0018787629 /DNA_START=68 /DNA_END=620 /DNA_ORIENTATION=-